MPVNAASAAAPSPLVFAGFPASSWAFALRVWLATMLALYASFWLELESPSSAALTVAILALPTRGQGMEKAGYRLLATAIGVMASIAIAGVFSQTDGLLLAVLGIWVGLCVYVAAMLDGNRAYAAALGCITVALIAIQQIDTPLQVFPTGIARGAAIGIGVLAVALVNEVLAAPDYHPVLAGRIEALYDRVKALTHGTDRDSAVAAASLLHDIAAIRPEIASLTTESSIGTARTAAARSALVDLVSVLSLGRMLAALPVTSAPAQSANGPGQKAAGLTAISRSWLRSEISHKLAQARSSLDALHQGVSPYHAWRAPLYRSRRIAAETGARAAISFALIGLFFVLTGWPTTELCLSLVAVILGLGSTAPAPRTFTMVTVMAMPIACALAGILKYFVFNGVSEFQLLAIGLAPVVIGFALLISSPNPLLSSLGRLTLVFTIAVLAPTNPQNYDPEVFLVTSFFACLSSVLVLAAQTLLPPLSGDQRVRLLLREATGQLGPLDRWRVRDLAPEEAAFRDAGRVEQILSANGASALNGQIAAKAMRCFDQAESLRRCRAELERLTQGPLARVVQDARDALAQRNGAAILGAAGALSKAASQNNLSANSAIAVLVPAAAIFAPSQPPTGPSQGKQP
ncbi:FUSC family protein [Bradyrhizobium sp. CCBAU 51765]|uniref:FUSC family protein n=1 Tax=Bradyrhizobium sp. CCBAU 51765 TaxID=1325102 RepID=UPI0018887DE2|nr:FUSC family protein [Bradyrhizobium sp. CCBAU 51765]QOZ10495.1 FUSC family protein [Bradyrhizobium sp. CCBAU 51765]